MKYLLILVLLAGCARAREEKEACFTFEQIRPTAELICKDLAGDNKTNFRYCVIGIYANILKTKGQ